MSPDAGLVELHRATWFSEGRSRRGAAGTAALETALALRDLCRDRISTTIISPDSEFVYRPMRVREPFAYSKARRYPLAEIAQDSGAELKRDAFKVAEYLAPYLDQRDRLVGGLA